MDNDIKAILESFKVDYPAKSRYKTKIQLEICTVNFQEIKQMLLVLGHKLLCN